MPGLHALALLVGARFRGDVERNYRVLRDALNVCLAGTSASVGVSVLFVPSTNQSAQFGWRGN
jgi:hypothetical protein